MKDVPQSRGHNVIGEKNPFCSEPVNGYTAQEIATLQARLDKQLGPEYIATRSNGSAGKVSYLESHKVIGLANEVFGFNGWSSTVKDISIDFVDERPDGRYNIGLTVVVRITLRDGAFHEDVGYGSIENCKGKAAAFEKCKKEGTTDAMKRALRTFGNVLGNCLYDKTFLKEIGRMKVPVSKFDPEMLHRRPEFALPADHPKMQLRTGDSQMPPPAMSRRASIEDGGRGPKVLRTEESYDDDVFDGLEFEEERAGNYDHVQMDTTLDYSETSIDLQAAPQSTNIVGNHTNYHAPNEFMKTKTAPMVAQQSGPRQTTMTQQEAKRLHALRAQAKDQAVQVSSSSLATTTGPPPPSARPAPPPFRGPLPTSDLVHPEIQGSQEPPPDYQPSFMTSRSLIQPTAPPAAFDPKIASPILQKSGIDHTKSTPIKRPGSAAAAPVMDSPLSNGSPLRRMGNQVTHQAQPGVSVGMGTRSNQFRAPSKLNPGLPNTTTGNGAAITQKRGSEALAEHPVGSISLNQRVASVGSDGGSAEKKSRT